MTNQSAGHRWPMIRDAGAFLLGVFILLWQTIAEDQADVTLVVVGFACLGVTGSGVAQRFIEARFPPAPPNDQGPPA